MPGRAAATPKTNIAKKFNCKRCSKLIVEKPKKRIDNSIDCGQCGAWFHVTECTNLTADQFDLLSSTDQEEVILWNCPDCVRDKGRDHKKLSCLEDALTTLTIQVGVMCSKMDGFDTHLENIIDQKVSEKVNEKFQEIVKTHQLQQIQPVPEVTPDEREEREKRKLNIVLVNIPESEKEDSKENTEEDLKRVTELLGTITQIEEGDVVEPVRLGQKDPKEKRPRFLRLRVISSAKKGAIFKNATKLNTDDAIGPKDRIYINRDLTPIQRKADSLLREEYARRRTAGEKYLKIRRGKIVVERPDVEEEKEDED